MTITRPLAPGELAPRFVLPAVAGEDGTVDLRPVEVGISDVTHVEIESGVAEGEQVITGPRRVLEDLEPGAHVRIATGEARDEEPERRGGFGPFG